MSPLGADAPAASEASRRASRLARLAPAAALGAVLLLATGLRLWRLEQNGYDNEYYSAAVRSMATGWRAFLYGSFDPGGFVSVDKPPVALWLQVLSVKLLGFHERAVLLPQALMGVGAVALTAHLVGRVLAPAAGVLAGLFLAITPVSVAIDRSSNTDSCLVLVLLLAAWATLRAAEAGSRRWLLGSMALVGIGFNVKMLAALALVPTLALVYALGAPVPWRRRIADLTLAASVLAAVALPWALAYDLTPAERRPFVGGSRENSVLELAVGHNGLGRFVRILGRPTTDGRPDQAGASPATGATPTQSPAAITFARLFVRAPVGPLRLADGQIAAQVGWLFPLAAMGLAAVGLGGWLRLLGPLSLSLILWLGWLLTYAVVYSAAGGIFHFYYLAALAPPLAALAAIGVTALWRAYRAGGGRAALLPAALLLTAAWQIRVHASAMAGVPDLPGGETPALVASLVGPVGDWRPWLQPVLLAGTLAGVLALAAIQTRETWRRPARPLAAAGPGVAVLALLAAPTAWALSSVLVRGIAVLPAADLARLVAPESATDGRAAMTALTRPLTEFLRKNRDGERFLLATSSARLAAPIIIETGEPVIAIGGFHGLDPILTPEGLAHLVEARQVRFVMLGDLSLISRRLGAEEAGRPIADWVRANGTLVDPAQWRPDIAPPRGARRPSSRGPAMQLYDLRPAPPTAPPG